MKGCLCNHPTAPVHRKRLVQRAECMLEDSFITPVISSFTSALDASVNAKLSPVHAYPQSLHP